MESNPGIIQIAAMKTHKIQPNLVILALMLWLSLGLIQSVFAVVTGSGSSWQYCRKITLSPVTPSAGYQVKVTFTTGQYTHMNSDGSDLRFYDVNNTSCNYWIEAWNNAGTSTIWVKVPVAGTSVLYMYYGNSSATATSNGSSTFDFFDDFTTALGSNWTTITSGGSVTQSGTTVTLSNTNGGTVSLSNTSAFTPSSTSFFLETKHREVGYNRNRFYATTGTSGGSPIAAGDYGYFSSNSSSQTSAQVFWGTFPGSTSVSNNTDYLTRWQITDGSTYNWYTLLNSTGVAVTNGSRTTTYGSNIRYISIEVTEVSGTSTIVDWVRVRQYAASESVGAAGGEVANLTASITAQTNVLCYGLSTGSATVTGTGGSTPYSYSWTTTPPQTSQTASNMAAGTYSVTVTENSIGISATATSIITQSAPLTSSVTQQSNISCNGRSDGTISITASGGTAPYTFSINNGSTYPGSGNPSYQFQNLPAGNNYKIRIKDSHGCESPAILP